MQWAALLFLAIVILVVAMRYRVKESVYLKKEYRPRQSGPVSEFDRKLEEKDLATQQKQKPNGNLP